MVPLSKTPVCWGFAMYGLLVILACRVVEAQHGLASSARFTSCVVGLPRFTLPRCRYHPLTARWWCRRMVLRRLQQIGSGAWGSDGVTERLFEGVPPTMELWRTRLNRVGAVLSCSAMRCNAMQRNAVQSNAEHRCTVCCTCLYFANGTQLGVGGMAHAWAGGVRAAVACAHGRAAPSMLLGAQTSANRRKAGQALHRPVSASRRAGKGGAQRGQQTLPSPSACPPES